MNAIRKDIYKHILTKIAGCELEKGDRIPTEVQLAKSFNTNRMNAHLAVKELEKSGIVKRNKRQGTTVTKTISDVDIDNLKTTASNIVNIMASPADKRFNIHWNESTLLDFETIVNQKGYRVYFQELPHNEKVLNECMDELSKKNSKALVILPDHGGTQIILDNLECFEKYRGDIIMLDRGGIPLRAFPYHTVGFNSYEEGVVAGKYLAGKGYTNIAYFGNKVGNKVGNKLPFWVKHRYEGLKFGLKGLCIPECHILDNRDSIGKAVFERITMSPEQLVIVGCNDSAATMALEYARKHGLNAPGDFHIMGFDNVLDLRSNNLTTVAIPIDKIGFAIANMIVAQLPWKKEDVILNIKLRSRIIERDTCS
jgi:DNA-binding LacI/PurR family transcriptional regulator